MREPELHLPKRVAITEEADDILNELKKELKKSKARITIEAIELYKEIKEGR